MIGILNLPFVAKSAERSQIKKKKTEKEEREKQNLTALVALRTGTFIFDMIKLLLNVVSFADKMLTAEK